MLPPVTYKAVGGSRAPYTHHGEGRGAMRKRLLVLLMGLLMVVMVAAGPAFASHVTTHPFCGSGQEYAQLHIKPYAQTQFLGPAHGHTPGFHSGFDVCDPSGHAGT